MIQSPQPTPDTLFGLDNLYLIAPTLQYQGRIEARETGTYHYHAPT
jgi:hypothetical protein